MDQYVGAADQQDRKAFEPLVIPLEEIEEQLTSKISLMPLGLLNTLTEAEILDLLAYVIAGQN